MFGLTQLGVIHTAISLIAVAAGLIALVRDKEISPRNILGKVYVITTVLFHLIPGITETTTRLPLGAPLLPNAEAPALQAASGALFVLFVIGAALQVRRTRAKLGA